MLRLINVFKKTYTPLSSVVAAEALDEDVQFLVTSFDEFSVFTTADDVSKPDTNDASAVNK